MRISEKSLFARTAVSLAAVFLALIFRPSVALGAADHVRWDIIHLDATTSPLTISAGGVAFASARNPSTLSIKLTGSGTFVGPASGGTSSAVTGGGTWETVSGATSTGSGTYEVTELVSWTFSNFKTAGAVTDLVGSGGDNV